MSTLLLLLLAHSPLATAAPTSCQTRALVADRDPAGLNVRSAPNGTILGQIPDGTLVWVEQSDGGWLRITSTWHPDWEDRRFPLGWVHGSKLTTELKTPAEYGPSMAPRLYTSPSTSAASGRIRYEPAPKITVLGCLGSWLNVTVTGADGQRKTGWLPETDHCPNPVTNCC